MSDEPSSSSRAMVKLPGGVQVSLQGATLVVVLGIGWFARDAFQEQLAAVEQTQAAVEDLQGQSTALRTDLGKLTTRVEENQALRVEFAAYRTETDARIDALVVCIQNRKKCEI